MRSTIGTGGGTYGGEGLTTRVYGAKIKSVLARFGPGLVMVARTLFTSIEQNRKFCKAITQQKVGLFLCLPYPAMRPSGHSLAGAWWTPDAKNLRRPVSATGTLGVVDGLYGG